MLKYISFLYIEASHKAISKSNNIKVILILQIFFLQRILYTIGNQKSHSWTPFLRLTILANSNVATEK